MSTFRGQFAFNLGAGSVLFLGSAIAAGSVHDMQASKIGLDSCVLRPFTGSGLWTLDPNVGVGSFSASQGGLPFFGLGGERINVPGDPKQLAIYAIGAMQVNGILFEGKLPNL